MTADARTADSPTADSLTGDAAGPPVERSPVVRVAAVDDHPTLLLGIEALLEQERMDYLGGAGTVAELLSRGQRPDVVLLDLRLADRSRPEANVGALLAAGAEVVVYTEGQQPARAREALRAGARTVVLKRHPPETLLAAVLDAASGSTHPTHELAGLLVDEPWLDPQLSPRERQVLHLYASNMPSKSVARRLGLKDDTIKTHLRRIKAKYTAIGRECGTKLDLRDRAVEDGVYDPDDQDQPLPEGPAPLRPW
ncbi:response regulator transcription factor [Pseudokineococcus sp. 1T1Z-3]|uniref:response regulator transcription factor n=1 Tax=Pseudokineococcus sp. 1T1Z-3 TaxID=3132745 RepID=UPI0030B15F85